MKIPVEVSARHVHLTEAVFRALFDDDARLTVKKELSQPGEFLSNERVAIVGPKRTLENVAVLGPFRDFTQGEISATDMYALGVRAPVRESGDISGSGPITLAGPKGQVTLPEGLILAKRHIHMTTGDAKAAKVVNRQTVKVKLSGDRALIFDEVVIRVSDRFKLAMHIDTDEGNAAGAWIGDLEGELIQ